MPIAATSALTRTTITTATQGVRQWLSRENCRGQTRSRLSEKASRVAESMAEFTDVRVAMIPVMPIIGTPILGQKREAASVRAVSEPASSANGTVPTVTMVTEE